MYFPRFTSCTVTDTFIRAFRGTRILATTNKRIARFPWIVSRTPARRRVLLAAAACRRCCTPRTTTTKDCQKEPRKKKKRKKTILVSFLLSHVRVTHTRGSFFLSFSLSLSLSLSLPLSSTGKDLVDLERKVKRKKREAKGRKERWKRGKEGNKREREREKKEREFKRETSEGEKTDTEKREETAATRETLGFARRDPTKHETSRDARKYTRSPRKASRLFDSRRREETRTE